MSNIPITSMPVAIALTGGEYVPIVQAGTTKRATVSQFNASNPANLPIGGTTGQALVKQSVANYDTIWKTVSGLGTVQEVDTGTGIAGGPITTTGTISLAAISPGTVLSNILGGISVPVPNTPSQVLDVIGSQQGDILYRSATGWQALAPSAAGFVLTTNGAAANPSWDLAGTGTVSSVGLSLPAIFTVSGSPVTSSGTLTGTLNTQAANQVWAGPTTGAAATPTFRSIVGADLPNPSATTLGGIQSTVGASHQWINSISTSGVPALSQPAFTDISGSVAAAQLPNPSPTTLGGIESLAAVTSKWINQISTSGVPTATQPAFSDISGNLALAQLPPIGNNTIVSNISGSSGTPLANSLSAVIDSAMGSTQGSILYRGASAWAALGPGSSGQALESGGAGANPSWATISGTGTVFSVATNNGITGGTITTSGTIGLATIATGNVLAYTGAGSGVPVATTPTTVLDVIGSTEGDVLYRGASTWAALPPGTAGQYLQTGGAGSTPSWASAVTSIAGNVGAFTLGIGLTHATNDLRVSLSTATNSLSGDVALNNTASFFDGPSMAQGTSGTWWAAGTVTLQDTAGGATFICKLWDGTTVIDSAVTNTSAASGRTTVSLSGFLASPAANIRISVNDGTSTSGKILFNNSGLSKDSTISGMRIA